MAKRVPDGPGLSAASGRRITGADVARRAGLSRATVSYVLNDTPHQSIPEHTRRRVLQAAAELGYTPSAAGRALQSGRSDVVLCLLPDWPIGKQVGLLLQHMSSEFARLGLTFVAHPRSPGDRPIAELWQQITPAAVVTFEQLPPADADSITRAGIALTVALFGSERAAGNALPLSEQRIGRLQAEHLAATGHRLIGYGYPADPRVVAFAESRLAGVRAACAELGLAAPDVRTIELDADAAAKTIAGWRTGSGVTGVCAYNDETAFAVLAGADRAGVRVPGDLAVIGVDDIPLAALAVPALTTVAADTGAVARHLARSISAGLAGAPRPEGPGSNVFEVIVRRSG